MKLYIISANSYQSSYLIEKIKPVLFGSYDLEVINEEVENFDKNFEESIVFFFTERISDLDKLPYYYDVFSIALSNEVSIYVLHTEGILNLVINTFPFEISKFYDFNLELKGFLNNLVRVRRKKHGQLKSSNSNFVNENFEVLAEREFAISKRLGINLSFSYIKIIKNEYISINRDSIISKANLREIDLLFLTDEGEILSIFPATNGEGANVATRKILSAIHREIEKYLDVDNCMLKVETLTYPSQLMDFDHMMVLINQFRSENVFLLKNSRLTENYYRKPSSNSGFNLSL